MSKKTILFVDGDDNMLSSMKRGVRDMRDQWDCLFAISAADGLSLMDTEPVDLVVTDIRMAGMDGLAFFEVVRERWPQVLRIIMSGATERKIGVEALQAASQVLAKPCTVDDLKAVIVEMLEIKELLGTGLIFERVIQLNSLPTLPKLYMQLKEQLEDISANAADVAGTIQQDPAMVTKVLQVANSAYFSGRCGPIVEIETAVTRLGIEPIADLALAVEAFGSFNACLCPNFNQEALWDRSCALSALARKIARQENLPRDQIEVAGLAGLLHGLGKLIMAVSLSEEYSEFLGRKGREPEVQRERQAFGSTHPTLGAYLAGIWGLPSTVCRTIAHYAEPSLGPEEETFGPRGAVHVANSLLSRDEPADEAFLEKVQKLECMDRWQTLAAEG